MKSKKQLSLHEIRFSIGIGCFNRQRDKKKVTVQLTTKGEITANGTYNRVLIEYLQNGPTQVAKKLLKNAIKNNPYVVDYLLQKKKLSLYSPATYSLGDI
ncbi:hypothetical protein B5V89_06375 [Heyndrickxia sporothermodurans]|uniref:hypothetical protein n=1 Tax=Heyndrickxia TaxID=2837504 RepID=UPI000D343141|nr:hypothetical protein [Heyndrickxia sporothermodurans]PTY79354.1 hypothetical protein B5V89_06375 [Heyndrickxia sporothermodurans]